MPEYTYDVTRQENTILLMITKYPRNDWESVVEAIKREGLNLSQLSDVASGLSVVAAEISEYLEQREYNNHDKSLAEAQKTRKKVRKALGYSMP